MLNWPSWHCDHAVDSDRPGRLCRVRCEQSYYVPSWVWVTLWKYAAIANFRGCPDNDERRVGKEFAAEVVVKASDTSPIANIPLRTFA